MRHDNSPDIADLSRSEQPQVTPRARHMIISSEAGDDSCREGNNFQKPSTVCGRSISVHRNTISDPRYHKALYYSQQDAPREEVTQVAETNQETDAFTYDVTDVGVPSEVVVKNHTEVFDARALLDGLATDPHADR